MLRRARPGDGAVVETLVFAILRAYGIEPDPEGIDRHVKDVGTTSDDVGYEMVAEDDAGSIVGVVCLLTPSPYDANAAHLSKLFVSERARGNGIGRQLHDAAIAEARRRGYARVTLTTRDVFVEAIRLYERAGWQRGEDRPDGRRSYDLVL